MWNIYAKNYDSATLSFTAYKELMQLVIENLKVTNKDSILDMGCGTGNLEDILAESDTDFSLVGLDISNEMLRVAQRKVRDDTRFNFKNFDLNMELTFESNSFNKVVMIHSLYTLNNLDSVLQNVKGVLVNGGELHIVNPLKDAQINKMVSYELKKSGVFVFIIKLLLTIPANIINRLIAKKADANEFHFLTNEEYILLLEKNGFSVVETSLVYANQSTYIISKITK